MSCFAQLIIAANALIKMTTSGFWNNGWLLREVTTGSPRICWKHFLVSVIFHSHVIKKDVRTICFWLPCTSTKIKYRTKTSSLSNIVDEMKENCLIDQGTALKLNESFSGLTVDIIQNQLKHQSRDPKGRRYSDEICTDFKLIFATSVRVYATCISLPHTNSSVEWTSSVHCEPGFFIDVKFEGKDK